MKRGHDTRLGAALILCSALGFWCIIGFAAAAIWEFVTNG